ncbi:MAG: DUF87 domain-containing protein [Anaerolineae bacterium]|nr:DUF87 domain-containing protein [Anaerolineae bacterium]
MNERDQRGYFYLGREYDLEAGTTTDRPFLYPARHLTTHAVLLGMTGSGKTGLGIVLLEEALLQGIPILAVDPKGDLTNLLLAFPSLSADEFAPWIDADLAQRNGLSVAEAAAQAARRWRAGLAEWDIGPERVARLRQAAEVALYTPGSDAGIPVDVLHRFQTPDLDWVVYEEVLRERIAGLVTALLSLAGREVDPLQSPEHVLLSHLVEHAWRGGQDLDLPALIRLLQDPPLRQIGVFDLESFLPRKQRFVLARALNNVLAAPGFADWRKGVSLEVSELLRTPQGRPRASIFYLPHLNDTERAFFITLLLEAVRDWIAAQSGTSELRAILYFDEVLGFFPPHPFRPPTKEPLMALIKQGRAAGLGVVLATQNPADLDYKGLTNAGTWAIGALRTERDKDRVLEGVEGAAAAAGAGFDRARLSRALGALKSRLFLFADVRADAPLFFHTRWAMSYLRGPMTRAQVRSLGLQDGAGEVAQDAVQSADVGQAARFAVAAPAAAAGRAAAGPPTLPADVPQVFVPAATTFEWALHRHEQRTGEMVLARSRRLVYRPHLLALGTVYLNDERKGVQQREAFVRLLDPPAPPAPVDWSQGEIEGLADELCHEPLGEGEYLPPPAHLARGAHYGSWTKSFAEHLYRTVRLSIWYNPALELYGRVGESRRDFRVRCEQKARTGRDGEASKARAAIDKRMARLQDRLRREERELAEDEADLAAHKREEMLSYGESALNLFTGRRPSYMISNVSRKRRLTQQAEADVQESLEAIDDLEMQLEELAAEWEEQAAAIATRWAATLEEFERVEAAPRRSDVVVDFCGLAWLPAWEVETEQGRRLNLPAFAAAAE